VSYEADRNSVGTAARIIFPSFSLSGESFILNVQFTKYTFSKIMGLPEYERVALLKITFRMCIPSNSVVLVDQAVQAHHVCAHFVCMQRADARDECNSAAAGLVLVEIYWHRAALFPVWNALNVLALRGCCPKP
jgi:hypothetical protein